MSRETYLKGDIGIVGVEVNHDYEVASRIEEAQRDVEDAKAKIKMLIAGTPKDLFPSDENGTTLEKLGWETDAAFEAYEEALTRLTKLYTIEINKDCIVDQYAEVEEK